MQNCISASPDSAPLVPNKRVNYAFGMVLGVSDFVQEQTHFEWKSRLANHLPHGYGILCGIEVAQEPQSGDVEIKVRPGYAISPEGHWLWVEKELCARLGAWIQKHTDPVKDHAPADWTVPVSAYVRLCYAQCATDLVPIAANACASAEDSSAASRIYETIAADFSWDKPDMRDQAAIRRFAELLAHVEMSAPVTTGDGTFTPDDTAAFFAAVRALVTAPAPPAVYRLPENTMRDTIHQGLTLWTTLVRPTLMGGTEDCFPNETDPDCMLLARLEFTWDTTANSITGQAVVIHQEDAPLLLDTKVLQEWLAALQANTLKYTDVAAGDVTGKFSALKVVGLQARPLAPDAPNTGQALVWNGSAWTPQTADGDVTGAYQALRIAKIQDKPVSAASPNPNDALVWDGTNWMPTPVLTSADVAAGDVTGTFSNLKVVKIQNRDVTDAAPTDGQALVWDNAALKWEPKGAVLDGDPAQDTVNNVGDLRGVYPFPTVGAIQKRVILDQEPTDGQALAWSVDRKQWEPTTIAPAPAPVDMNAILDRVAAIPVLPLATISLQTNRNAVAVLPPFFRIWFHLSPGEENRLAVAAPKEATTPIAIFGETGSGPTFLAPAPASFPFPDQTNRNVWDMTVTPELQKFIEGNPLLRFVFHLDVIQAARGRTTPAPLLNLMNSHAVHWQGFDGTATVTIFFDTRAIGVTG